MLCLNKKCKTCTDRKNDILAAVIEIIGSEGVSALTHRNVARKAGVSLSSTTYHFKSKEDMVRQAFDKIIQEDIAEHEKVFSQLQSGNCDLESLVKKMFPLEVAKNPQLKLKVIAMYELMLENVRNHQYGELLEKWHHAHIDLLLKTVKDEYLNFFSIFEIYSVFNGILLHMLSGVKNDEGYPIPYTKKYFKDFSLPEKIDKADA